MLRAYGIGKRNITTHKQTRNNIMKHSVRGRFLLLRFYMERIWLVLTGSDKELYVLSVYEQRGTKLVELAEKANGLCVRKF